MSCEICHNAKAVLIRPKNKQKLCKQCFITTLEDEIHEVIQNSNLFRPGLRIAVAISGGKDSTVLAHILNTLNKKYNYNVHLHLLSVDEGIAGYRDASLATVEQNKVEYNLPLKIVSYQEYFNQTMDSIVSKVGRKSNCTYCGVLRRQALENGAKDLGMDLLITGHNADDMAETVLMNILRGDIKRLKKCTQIVTKGNSFNMPRAKIFKYVFEKEIVMYAFYNKLTYFSTECTYFAGAYRGTARLFVKELERKDPMIILNIIKAGEELEDVKDTYNDLFVCDNCGHPTSAKGRVCMACELLKHINSI